MLQPHPHIDDPALLHLLPERARRHGDAQLQQFVPEPRHFRVLLLGIAGTVRRRGPETGVQLLLGLPTGQRLRWPPQSPGRGSSAGRAGRRGDLEEILTWPLLNSAAILIRGYQATRREPRMHHPSGGNTAGAFYLFGRPTARPQSAGRRHTPELVPKGHLGYDAERPFPRSPMTAPGPPSPAGRFPHQPQ